MINDEAVERFFTYASPKTISHALQINLDTARTMARDMANNPNRDKAIRRRFAYHNPDMDFDVMVAELEADFWEMEAIREQRQYRQDSKRVFRQAVLEELPGIAPHPDATLQSEYYWLIPISLRRKTGLVPDDIAHSLSINHPEFGIVDEQSLFDYIAMLYGEG